MWISHKSLYRVKCVRISLTPSKEQSLLTFGFPQISLNWCTFCNCFWIVFQKNMIWCTEFVSKIIKFVLSWEHVLIINYGVTLVISVSREQSRELRIIIISVVAFSTIITLALILSIVFGEPQVNTRTSCNSPLLFAETIYIPDHIYSGYNQVCHYLLKPYIPDNIYSDYNQVCHYLLKQCTNQRPSSVTTSVNFFVLHATPLKPLKV